MKHRRIGTIFMVVGALLVIAAVGLVGYNLREEQRAGAHASEALAAVRAEIEPTEAMPETDPGIPLDESEILIPDYELDPGLAMPELELDGQKYLGVVEIPALALSLPVISEWSYPNLRLAPCRYQGSAYQDDLIIMAHNYKHHFGDLLELQPGDEVKFTDMTGNEFHYEVIEMENLPGSAVEDMEAGEWDLTLFTCTIGGQTRVTIRCERTEQE